MPCTRIPLHLHAAYVVSLGNGRGGGGTNLDLWEDVTEAKSALQELNVDVVARKVKVHIDKGNKWQADADPVVVFANAAADVAAG